MMVPVKMQGAFMSGRRFRDSRIVVAFSNQWRAERLRPYRVRRKSQYVFGSLRGQPAGGRSTYCSSGGNVAWTKACLKSPWRRGRR